MKNINELIDKRIADKMKERRIKNNTAIIKFCDSSLNISSTVIKLLFVVFLAIIVYVSFITSLCYLASMKAFTVIFFTINILKYIGVFIVLGAIIFLYFALIKIIAKRSISRAKNAR